MNNDISLKERVEKELSQYSFDSDKGGDKEFIRKQHSDYKKDFINKNKRFWLENHSLLEESLIDGKKITVEKIRPKLIPIERLSRGVEGKLFRLARFNWSIPTSNGFGRRLRFLVWDSYHDALIGIIGLTDPVFNMKARDEIIGWDRHSREEKLVSVLDAFALGALPPYNQLLGGKLVASLLMSKDIQKEFSKRYGKSCGIISGVKKRPKLALITTTSVLGRSSVYNRLKLDGKQILEPVGFTSGYGHFHINDRLFSELKQFVLSVEPEKVNSYVFGQGPNWKIRVIREALKHLGVNQAHVRHGFRREIFVSKLYDNSIGYLNANEAIGTPLTETTARLGKLAVQRWMINRARRDSTYRSFEVKEWIDNISRECQLDEICEV
ncbi:Druantia anti-phage system protein DruA [Vibrio harveyi]